VEQTTIRCKC